MRALYAFLWLFVLVAPQSVVPFFCSDAQDAWPFSSAGSDSGPSIDVSGWWTAWFRDLDSNGIDDLLDARDAGSKVNIFVDYSRRPGARDLEALSSFGSGLHDAQYIDTLVLYDVDVQDLGAISRLPGVVMVEDQCEFRPVLDISVGALRVRNSTAYANDVWSTLGITGKGCNVAIIDTGVDDRFHDSLDDLDDVSGTTDPKYVAGYDCSGSVWVTGNPEDNDGHGSHCAGIAVGTGGAAHTYSGMAPGAGLLDIKVMSAWGTASGGKVIEGMRWCIEHQSEFCITVLSMSLGTQSASDGNDAVSQMANTAVRAGIAIVVAAGNDGPNNVGLGAPGAADDVITVGATDDRNTYPRSDDTIAYFSSRGPRASDGDLNRTDELKPDISAPGVNIMSVMARTAGGYVSMSGTSMSCPHIAGLVALMHEANPSLTPKDVKEILRETAEARGTPYNTSLDPKYDTAYGFGIADAYGAVRRALDLRNSNWSGPSLMGGGSSAAFNLSMNWTRTEFTTDQDSLFFNASIPNGWGKPQSVTLTGPGATAESTILGPVSQGQGWNILGWLNYSGTSGACVNLTPALSFVTFAPSVTQNTSYDFSGTITADGREADAMNLTVMAVPAGLLRPELAIGSGDISFSTSGPQAADDVIIHAHVRNLGTTGANSDVAFYDGPPGINSYLGRANISVPGGGEDTGSYTWRSSAGRHRIFAQVDSDNAVNESNESNNEANATIVVSGTNTEPLAVLNASASKARTGDIITFDASGSSDSDGYVVYNSFDFGDGTGTGLSTSPAAEHAYQGAGNYDVRLTVQDNGAAEGRTTVTMGISLTVTKELTFHLYPEGLDIVPPAGNQTSARPCPSNGGSGDWREVGTWNAPPQGVELTVEGKSKVGGMLRNTISNASRTVSLELTAFNGSKEVNRTVLDAITMKPGESVPFTATISLPRFNVQAQGALALRIRVRVSADGVEVAYASAAADSWVSFILLGPPDLPPRARAGPDIRVHLAELVHFQGRAADPDGPLTIFEWDFNGDGTWDYTGTSGITDNVYQAAGTFRAAFRVRDNGGHQATSYLQAVVLETNRAPIIQSASPDSPVTLTEGDVKQFAVTATDADGDDLYYNWYLDGERLADAYGPSYLYHPAWVSSNPRVLRIAVSDLMDTASIEWAVKVIRRNGAPEIRSWTPQQDAVTVREDETASFSVSAVDPDGDRLSYEWFIGETKFGTSKSFTYIPDYTSSGTYVLTVTVSDGKLNTTLQWALTVTDVNRAPKVRIMSPGEGSVFVEGTAIQFEGQATDADRDELEYTWTSDRSGTIGTSKSVTKALEPGTYKIRLTVSDGKTDSYAELSLVVKAKPKKADTTTPGFEAVLVAGALVFATFAVRRRKE